LDKGKGAASSSTAPSGAGVSKEERRRRLCHADNLFVSDPIGEEISGQVAECTRPKS
jgi:hypothetical protein